MIMFDACAVRAIITAIALYVGIATPPILVSQTKQLLCCGFSTEFSTRGQLCPKQQPVNLFLHSSGFTLSLEWTIFNPNRGFCEDKNLPPLNVISSSPNVEKYAELLAVDNDILVVAVVGNISRSISDDSDICLCENIFIPPVCSNSSLNSLYDPEHPLSTDEHEDIPTTVISSDEDTEMPTLEPSVISQFKEDLYQPLPESDSGVLSFHEQWRLYLRKTVLNALPATWANWITRNRPTLGLICVSVMFGSLLCPLLFHLWRQTTAKNRLSKQLVLAKSTSQVMDLQMLTLTRERDALTEKFSNATTHFKNLEEMVNSHILQLSQTNQEKACLEVTLNNVSNSLSTAQSELSQYQSLVEKLEDDAQESCEKMARLTSEHSLLLVNVANLVEEKQALEAERQMLKCANETTVAFLTELEAKHDQTLKKFTTTKAAKESQISSLMEQLAANNITLCKQERELNELQECLSQVTSQTAELAGFEDLLHQEVPIEIDTKTLVSDVHDVLGEVQVELDLQQCKDEIEKLSLELEKKESPLEKSQTENNDLKQQVSLLKAESRANADQLKEVQLKTKGLTEYFDMKENDLQRKLFNTERIVNRFELLDCEAREKLATVKEEIEKERKEWKDTKEQLYAVIKSLTNKVHMNRKRAEDSMKYAKFTEQEMRMTNRDIARLKIRLTESMKMNHARNQRRIPRTRPHTPVLPPKESQPSPDCPPSKSSALRLLTHRATQPKLTFPLTQIKSTPLPNRTPSHPSPLLQSERDKNVSPKQEEDISPVSRINSSISSDTTQVQEKQVLTSTFQSDSEDSGLSEIDEFLSQCDDEDPIVVPSKNVQVTTPTEHEVTEEPTRDILLSFSNLVRSDWR